MTGKSDAGQDRNFAGVLEIAIRLGLLVALAAWCFQIARPFLDILVWAAIIAIAVYPAYRWMLQRLGGRKALTAGLMVSLGLLIVIVPAAVLGKNLVEAVSEILFGLERGTLRLPPANAAVRDWPIVGERLWQLWSLATTNLDAARDQIAPQIAAFLDWLVATGADTTVAILKFAAAIVIAGVFMTHAAGAGAFARGFFGRIYDNDGGEVAALAVTTVRSVATGILGVALIQAILGGLGMLVAGVPGAGLLSLLCLLLAVVQLPPALVLLPAAIYLFEAAPLSTAVPFLIWALLVSPLDNILKPILLGRGTPVPMLVVFVGAIGGFMLSGMVGLFTGAVVMSLGYTLFVAWLGRDNADGATAAQS